MDNRAEFERAVTDKWSDSYMFNLESSGRYVDEILEAMFWAWQASLKAIDSYSGDDSEAKLTEEIGHLEDRVISQGQMLRDIVNITKGPPVDKMHSTHDAVASVARLKAISDNAIRARGNT